MSDAERIVLWVQQACRLRATATANQKQATDKIVYVT